MNNRHRLVGTLSDREGAIGLDYFFRESRKKYAISLRLLRNLHSGKYAYAFRKKRTK